MHSPLLCLRSAILLDLRVGTLLEEEEEEEVSFSDELIVLLLTYFLTYSRLVIVWDMVKGFQVYDRPVQIKQEALLPHRGQRVLRA